MDNPLDEYVNVVNYELLIASTKELARRVYAYYNSLIEIGFSDTDAMILVVAYQTFILANIGGDDG